jgi:hypothetical protein
VTDAKEWKKRSAELHAEVQSIVAAGHCPTCGSDLRRNLAIAGWWQCSQYGAPQFRARPDQPTCTWQGFTE